MTKYLTSITQKFEFEKSGFNVDIFLGDYFVEN